MELEEFKSQYIRGSKEFRITDSWGVYDAYKHIRKNGWYDIGRPLKEGEFYSIIRSINNILAEMLGNGEPVVLPQRMGSFELRKYNKGVKMVDGKLKVTYPVDWSKTWKLWYEDSEMMDKKVLLRDEQEWVYYIKYCKQSANYDNKCFYYFTLNRKIKKALKENIKNGKIDALW